MEPKTTKVVIEIPAKFDQELALSLAKKKANRERISKAKEIVRLAEIGYEYEKQSMPKSKKQMA